MTIHTTSTVALIPAGPTTGTLPTLQTTFEDKGRLFKLLGLSKRRRQVLKRRIGSDARRSRIKNDKIEFISVV